MQEVFNNPIPLLAGTLLILFLVSFIILFVVYYNKVQLKFQLERQQFHRELLEAEIEIREQTLSNVSQELHDNVGQIAALLKMNLRQVVSDSSSQSYLDQSNKLILQLIQDIKNVSSSLENHQLAEIALNEVIKRDCLRIRNMGFIEVIPDCKAELVDLDVNTSIFLYRMYQEAINNVISHSQASKVSVVLQQDQKHIQLQIQDNGIGFEQEKGRLGNGLENLRKRAKTIGAKLEITSNIGQGTAINILLPLKAKHGK